MNYIFFKLFFQSLKPLVKISGSFLFQDAFASLKIHGIFDRFTGKYFIQCSRFFFKDLLKEFSGMKFKIFPLNFSKFPGGKMQFSQRNFTNIAEIKRKIHGIRQKL